MTQVARQALKQDDRKLYKFRSFYPHNPEYISRIFTHHELYFPSPSQLNDPFECKPFVCPPPLSTLAERLKAKNDMRKIMRLNGTSRDDVRRLSKTALEPSRLRENAAYMTEKLPHLMESYRICSFSSIWNSLLMWSHYSDSHRGICLVFDADNDDFGSAMKIQYSDKYPSIDFLDGDPDTLLELVVLTKARVWEYENEFRLLSREPRRYSPQLPICNHFYTFPKERLLGVIFGCEISSENEKFIREIALSYAHPIRLQRAMRSKDKYSLELFDV